MTLMLTGKRGRLRKKGKIWFDKDRSRLAGHKACEASIAKAQEYVESAERALIAALASVQGQKPGDQAKYRGEVAIAAVRLEALQSLKESQNKLDLFIAKVNGSKVANSKAAAAASSSGSVGGVGNAPPSQRYAELLTLCQLSAMTQDIWDCESAAEITALKKKIVDQRAPIMELCTSGNQAVKDIEKLTKTLKSADGKPKAKQL